MLLSTVLDTSGTIDEAQVASFFSNLTLKKVLFAAILLVFCIILIRLLLKTAEKLFSRSKLEPTIIGFLRASIKAVLIFIAVMLIAGTLGVDTTSLLAILSVAGLAVSLSVQNALSNVAGALMLLSAKPFRVGDYVQIGDKAGTVLAIGAIYTTLRTYDNQLIHLPNSQVTSSSILNTTAEPERRVDLTILMGYDVPAEQVREALVAAAKRCEGICAERPVEAHVSAYAERTISYTLRFWAKTEDYWRCYNTVYDSLPSALREAGIPMDCPHINVHMGS